MSISSTGVAGLLAFQRSLETISHNIANAATEGYSRQRVELTTLTPQYLTGNYIGQGVRASSIRRIQDDLVSANLRTNLSNNSNAELRAAFAERVERIVADDSTGLVPSMEHYFDAIQDVADDPTAKPARIAMLEAADTLAKQFGAVNDQLEEQRSMVNGQIRVAVDEINQYAQSLADLNRRILSGANDQSSPGDLLDQRDTLLNKLSEQIDVATVKQEDGAINVFIGTGQALVMGNHARSLTAGSFGDDPTNLEIGYVNRDGSTPSVMTSLLTGGELGGLLETRTSVLDPAQNRLGLIGLTLATKFNEQNRLGLNAEGELGQDIFSVPDARVYTKASNADPTLAPTIAIEDVTQIGPSDYRLRKSASGFELTRQPSNATVTLVPDATDPNILIGDGLRIDTTAIASATAGDQWLIQPTRPVAGKLEVTMTDPTGIAAISGALAGAANTGEARPTAVRLAAAPTSDTYLPAAVVVNDTGDTFNLISPRAGAEAGAASIKSFTVLDPKNAQLTTAAAITFDSAKKQFVVSGERFSLDPSGTTTLAANGWELKVQGTPDNGTAFEIDVTATAVAASPAVTTIAGSGWEMDLRGIPAAYDTFTLDLSKGRTGDNRNLLAMANLQNERIVEEQATFQGGYSNILASVGTQTRQAQVTRDSSATLLADAQAQRETISGVNLDEEAANLLRFQQAYQAAAQVIAVAGNVFDTLMDVVRR